VTPYEGSSEGLPFLVGAGRRVKLPAGDLGPRAVAVAGHTAFVANYFSDTVSVMDLSAWPIKVESVDLRQALSKDTGASHGAVSEGTVDKDARAARLADMSVERRGEFYFHDATLCLQGWQSCSSCHPGDARADGINWDLPNDGIGNPKNTKSLLLAHQTPPAMSLGVRTNAETAVREGIKHILFTQQPEEVAMAIDAYLKSLRPVPSPHLDFGGVEAESSSPDPAKRMTSFEVQGSEFKVQSSLSYPTTSRGRPTGRLSASAQRGAEIFKRAACNSCHPPGLFTDLRSHDVGTRRAFDKPTDTFDTPTLVELWRTAPYLHDGSAATVREVLTTRNPHDEHGRTSNLLSQEMDDLCEYVLSL
jgi:cytochrome c peroxidase